MIIAFIFFYLCAMAKGVIAQRFSSSSEFPQLSTVAEKFWAPDFFGQRGRAHRRPGRFPADRCRWIFDVLAIGSSGFVKCVGDLQWFL